jgi:antitoxin component YwqK of YwqJK toxin-antitoxin module
MEEDTSFNNHNSFSKFRLTANSFTFEFYEDGSIKSKIYFTPESQKLIVNWPNGKLKIKADYDANRYSYCGEYKEYDSSGSLIIKGQYFLSNDPLTLPQKNGIWKYYESGKLKKKEKHKII